jgi:hypothetical protein
MTRVVLHKPHDNFYEELYTEMEKEGFSKTITDKESQVEYKLPPAEYYMKADLTNLEVFNKAKRAIKIITNNFALVVTGRTEVKWNGLDEVEE